MRSLSLLLAACAVLLALAGPVRAADFSDWIAVVVAGDNRSHDGAPSEAFDNGRRDFSRDLMSLGIPRENIVEFSVAPDRHPGTLPSKPGSIASSLWDLSSRTHAGCILYVTSHGSPEGVVIADQLWEPDQMANAIDNACGGRPTVVFVSACYSGIFVPAVSSPERLVVTAARPDRTSFGCGNTDRYTYFDKCVLESFSGSGNFPALATAARTCVGQREQAMKVGPPSEPQIALGATAANQLPHWR